MLCTLNKTAFRVKKSSKLCSVFRKKADKGWKRKNYYSFQIKAKIK